MITQKFKHYTDIARKDTHHYTIMGNLCNLSKEAVSCVKVGVLSVCELINFLRSQRSGTKLS